MENIVWDDVVFKLRKTRQKLALSLTPLGAVCAAAEGTGYKNRRLGKSHVVRFDSILHIHHYFLWSAFSLSCTFMTIFFEARSLYLAHPCGLFFFLMSIAHCFLLPLDHWKENDELNKTHQIFFEAWHDPVVWGEDKTSQRSPSQSEKKERLRDRQKEQ